MVLRDPSVTLVMYRMVWLPLRLWSWVKGDEEGRMSAQSENVLWKRR